jgi:hypothetical protein
LAARACAGLFRGKHVPTSNAHTRPSTYITTNYANGDGDNIESDVSPTLSVTTSSRTRNGKHDDDESANKSNNYKNNNGNEKRIYNRGG